MTGEDPDLDAELLGALMDALPAEAPSTARRAELLRAIDATPRFERFMARTAALCDLAESAAATLLQSIDDATRWMVGPAQGVQLFHIDAGPRLQDAICGFVRMTPGARFPLHAHAGPEVALVLSGGLRTSDGRVVRAGEELAMAEGSSHDLTALPGPDLLYLIVVERGIVFDGEQTLAGPDDPRT